MKRWARLGFGQADWQQLRDELATLARRDEAVPMAPDRFGQKFVIRGIIQGPKGRSAALVTVWIVLLDESAPRFITAYPGEVS